MSTHASPSRFPEGSHGVKAQGNLTGHVYDDIQEYDNPTPGWWHAIFAATIVFSIAYLLVFHFSVFGWSIHESWDDHQREEFVRIFGEVGELKTDEATILEQMNNPKFMTIAKSTFIGNCAACHRRDGGGDVGVNLCDDAYKNVKNIEDLYKVITEGANSGAMPSWKNRLSNNERVIVAAYVASLRGTTPETGRAPEGVVIPPWPTPAPAAQAPKPAAK